MNKYLVVSTDERSYLDLKNVVLELKNRNLPYFFLYSNSNNRIPPQHNLDKFLYDTNIESTDKKYLSKTLGFELPFKPDVLLITNENWEPEKTILWEFKQLGCFIGCIENSSWMHNTIKCKLEISSRKSFPTNCIDVFFDHSKWGLESKSIAGWWSQKSIITGNPKFDNFNIYSKKDTKTIIVYGSMEIEHHNNLLQIYSNLLESIPEWKILYKPHPLELLNFKDDFKDINLIKNNIEYIDLIPTTPYHIGIFSSIMFYPLIYDKNIVTLDYDKIGINEELDLETFRGYKFDFWKKVLGFKDFKEFELFIGEDFIKNIKNRNKKLQNLLEKYLISYDKDLIFLNRKSNNKALIKLYDEFNDNKASERIINYIEKIKN